MSAVDAISVSKPKELVFTPEIFKGLELAFAAVEAHNKQLYKWIDGRQSSQRSHTYFGPIKTGAIVVTQLEDGKKMLCFCSDDNEEQRVFGAVLTVKKRFLLPVSEVVEFVNAHVFNEGFVSQLMDLYGVEFKPSKPKFKEHREEFSRERTAEEMLGASLFQVLGDGKGEVTRVDQYNGWCWLKDDKPFELLCEKATAYMEREKVSAFG